MKGFVNPYNFIKLPQNRAKAYDDADFHTGVIEYTVTTKTPLFIPNSSFENAFKISEIPTGKEKKEHKSYDFFSYTELEPTKRYDDEYHVPVIPGSEMRGVVRNIYETLTDSCMGILNDGTYPVKRSASRFTPALIHKDKNGNMELLKALSLRIGDKTPKDMVPKGFEKYHNGSGITDNRLQENSIISLNDIQSGNNNGRFGYLIKWGMGVRKGRYHVYVPQTNSKKENKKRLTRDVVEKKLIPVINSYLSQPSIKPDNEKAYINYKNDLINFLNEKEEAYFPVTCSEINNTELFYLAPAIFSKEVSDNNIGKLAGKFSPCNNDFCPACDLFGHIGRDSSGSKGSKLRFSDMYVKDELDPKDYYAADSVTIPSLAEPKLGNTEFYLERKNNADFWTYDYYTKNGKASVDYGILRGRKFYWHHANKNVYANIINNKNVEPSNLNKTIRPVKDEISFKGKLYFDGISYKQLKQLIWILNSKSLGIGYKLGGAKPYGFGSVVSVVDNVMERKITVNGDSLAYEKQKFDYSDLNYESVGFSESVKEDFIKISGLYSIPEDVEITYPKTYEQKNKPLSEGYKWFMNNHGTISGNSMAKSREDIRIHTVLPRINDNDISMPYYKENDFVNRSGRGNDRNNMKKKNNVHKNGKSGHAAYYKH